MSDTFTLRSVGQDGTVHEVEITPEQGSTSAPASPSPTSLATKASASVRTAPSPRANPRCRSTARAESTMRYDIDLESIVRKRNAGTVSWGYRHKCAADSPEKAAQEALGVARSDLRPSETIVKSTASGTRRGGQPTPAHDDSSAS